MSTDTAAPPTEQLRIDVVSDVVCPWCFVGKRQLEQALERWQAAHPDAPEPLVAWRPFQLNPGMPVEGISRDEYLISKFGRSDVSKLFTNVRTAAESVGLSLNLESIGRQPSTLRPHAMLEKAAGSGVQHVLAEALFNAYFLEGRDLTSADVLADIAREAGLPEADVQAALNDESLHAQIADQDEQVRDMGISGVPCFIVNGRYAVSGAQGADRLVMAFTKAMEKDAS